MWKDRFDKQTVKADMSRWLFAMEQCAETIKSDLYKITRMTEQYNWMTDCYSKYVK